MFEAKELLSALIHLIHEVVHVDADATRQLFSVCSKANPDNCAGSAYTVVTAAWANIGYLTHADFIHLFTDTGFGAWAPLLYVVAAIGALIGVALNNPPRNYTWFFLGPAIFNFLVFTPTETGGVAWRVGSEYQDMRDVWKNAETGVGNTMMVKRLGLNVSKEQGPGNFQAAYGLVFLDQLFSSTTATLVNWIGIGRQDGKGSTDSNLAKPDDGNEEGPWYILANLKWEMVQNIVGATARDPDVRDALVTFLASECGDAFKKGVDSGNYIASQQSKGKAKVDAVLRTQTNNPVGFLGINAFSWSDYKPFARGLDTEVIPTPRSVVRLLRQDPNKQGSFTAFSETFKSGKQFETGRDIEIVCSEYLYTIIQALRWESGHAYWNLVRSSPNGFTRTRLLQSIFYGWDIRKNTSSPYASSKELEDFTKILIFVYMLKNELLFAPQLTESPQRYSPSETTRNFTETYVRDQGSKAKAGELYNWAIMMPHVQGILTYLILIAYPFAAMLMLIPGYWKAFFSWITFLAWVKLWDVGFAIVHTLERSVWAMIGNGSSMATFANAAIQTAEKSGGIKVGEACSNPGERLSELCAVPDVLEGKTLTDEDAWGLFDKVLMLTGSADLDVSNGYYIYIMAALYFAVPAVTGQLVLGAKAGLGSLATQGIQQNAQEAGGAAKSGTVGDVNQRIGTNTAALGQAAKAKGYRQSGLALQQLDNMNAGMDSGLNQERMQNIGGALSAAADARGLRASSFDKNFGVQKALMGVGIDGIPSASGTGSGSSGTGNSNAGKLSKGQKLAKILGDGYLAAGTLNSSLLDHDRMGMQARAGMYKADAAWDGMASGQRAKAFVAHAERLGQLADFDADTNSWEARNAFGYQIAGSAGVYGANPGNFTAGPKPDSKMGFAMSGQLGQRAAQSGFFTGGQFFGNIDNAVTPNKSALGSSYFGSHWEGQGNVSNNFSSGGKNWNGNFGQFGTAGGVLAAPIGGIRAEAEQAYNTIDGAYDKWATKQPKNVEDKE